MTKLKDSVVFITGASSGIGEACALAFAAEGARLLLAARRMEKLRELEPGLRAAGAADVRLMALDVRDANAVASAIAELPEPWSSIHILVNNAGLSRGLDKVHEGRLDDWEEMIDTNLKGVLYVTRSVVPAMVARGQGHIVNLGSTAGEIAYPGAGVYCATKAGLKALNDGLRMDLLGTPIRVTSVDPGMVETEFSEVRFHGDKDRAAKVYKGLQPLQPEDVADAIIWAVSRPARVNIAHVLMTSVDQANSLLFNRK